MKSKLILSLVMLIIVGGVMGYYTNNSYITLPTFINKEIQNNKYIIKKSGKIIDRANTYEEAIKLAKTYKRSVAINTVNNEWIYSNLEPFLIFTEKAIHDFNSFKEAYVYAKNNNHSKIYYNNDIEPIWNNNETIKQSMQLQVPHISQMPELPRGCEVTSLAMLFKYNGVEIDKMQLAEEIKKDPTPYSTDKNGRIQYGNPYDGFVGDMYDLKKNGYGVYHTPIVELGEKYFGSKAIDITGLEFDEILYFISKGYPVWIITNVLYKPLEDSYFEFWHTPTGVVKVTKKLHSVIITGFDDEYITINDPLHNVPNRKVNRDQLKKSWEQMGNQAVVIVS